MLSFDNFSEKESTYLLTVLVAVAFGTLLVFSFQSKSSKVKAKKSLPSLTEKDIENVQSSWKVASPHASTAADIFYEKLLKNEEVKNLFPKDMTRVKKELMGTISLAVDSLENLQEIVPKLEKLGKLHKSKKVKEEHYDLVGQCLIDTLTTALSKEVMTEEVTSSWVKTYTILSIVMKGDLYE